MTVNGHPATGHPAAGHPATGQRATGQPATGEQPGGWKAAESELRIAGGTVIVITVAAYAWAGPVAAAVVLAGCALLALVLLRSLAEPDQTPVAPREEWKTTGRSVIAGFWRKRSMVNDATAGNGNYDFELRATLQHLLAARLAERHGVSLYAEPDRARELFGGRRRDDLWRWVDPARQAAASTTGGIPPRTLALIIDRLEHL
jgi:hypothetical protein